MTGAREGPAQCELHTRLGARLTVQPTQAILADIAQMVSGQGTTLTDAISNSGLLDSIHEMTTVLSKAIQETREHRIEEVVTTLANELAKASETTRSLHEGFQAEAEAQVQLIGELRGLSDALQPAISELRSSRGVEVS